jgi:outer membrane receptor for Fe3+-dicitrate
MNTQLIRFVSLCLALLLIYSHGQAQNAAKSLVTIQGKVTDQNRRPVHGVTVAEVDEEQRTIRAVTTDVEGNFVIRVSNTEDSLNFSYIGNETIRRGIGSRTVINISMISSSAGLGEVIVVGQRNTNNGLMNISERNITTATAKINAKELEEMQAASIDQALQGRLPGVDITAASGDPGAGMQIRIRGTSSINSSSDPLIVVDGMGDSKPEGRA